MWFANHSALLGFGVAVLALASQLVPPAHPRWRRLGRWLYPIAVVLIVAALVPTDWAPLVASAGAAGVLGTFILASATGIVDGTTRAAKQREATRNVLALSMWFGQKDLEGLETSTSFVASHRSDREKALTLAEDHLGNSIARCRAWMLESERHVTKEMGAAQSLIFRNHSHVQVNRTRPTGMDEHTGAVWDDVAGRLAWLGEQAQRLSE